MKRIIFIVGFYLKWIIYLRITTTERRWYLKRLSDWEITERSFSTFLEYKRDNWVYKSNHDARMINLEQKIKNRNQSEYDEMVRHRNVDLKIEALELKLKISRDKLNSIQ